MNLELWRTSLPDIMKWKDNDPPPNDINVARMRAKYYGARYIIHRPLLYHALHYAANPNTQTPPVESPSAPALTSSKSQQVYPSMTHSQRALNMTRMPSDLGTMGRSSFSSGQSRPMTYRDLPTKLRRACKVCVDSAILSTQAFDGINGRPVVTNIFGTAHAYVISPSIWHIVSLISLLSYLDNSAICWFFLPRTCRIYPSWLIGMSWNDFSSEQSSFSCRVVAFRPVYAQMQKYLPKYTRRSLVSRREISHTLTRLYIIHRLLPVFQLMLLLLHHAIARWLLVLSFAYYLILLTYHLHSGEVLSI